MSLARLLAVVALLGLTGATVFRPTLDGLLNREAARPAPVALEGVECLGRVEVDGGVVDLASVRAGRVEILPAREGDVVSAGVVLLRLDEQPARLQIQQARAARTAALAQVALAEDAAKRHPSQIAGQDALVRAAGARVSAAREMLRKKERLYAQSLIGREERATARDEVKALEAVAEAERKRLEGLQSEDPSLRVKQAQAEVARAEASLAEAQYALEQCVVKAPSSGRVLRVRCGVGEVVSPQVAVIVFAPERPLLVRAEVEQELIHLVEVGQVALVRDEMNPEWSCKGRVTRIGEWYSDTPTVPRRMASFRDMPTVECVVALDVGHAPLRIGQRMTVFLRKAAE